MLGYSHMWGRGQEQPSSHPALPAGAASRSGQHPRAAGPPAARHLPGHLSRRQVHLFRFQGRRRHQMQVFPWGCDWLFPQPDPCGDPAAAGLWVPVEVAWSPAPPGMCVFIVLGLCGRLLALSRAVGGSQGVTAMPFPQGRWRAGRGCAWCPGARRALRNGTWGTHPTFSAWPFRQMASTWYGRGRWHCHVGRRGGGGACISLSPWEQCLMPRCTLLG